jgi:hypothetical protein
MNSLLWDSFDMSSKCKIFFVVEGLDDQRFVERIICPQLKNTRYYFGGIQQHAEMKDVKVKGLIKTYVDLKFEFIFMCDFDSGPCFTVRKNRHSSRYSPLPNERVLVVKKKIEGWYMAGVDKSFFKKHRLECPGDVENVDKHVIEEMAQRAKMDLTDFKIELLRNYNWNKGLERCPSLRRLNQKYLIK